MATRAKSQRTEAEPREVMPLVDAQSRPPQEVRETRTACPSCGREETIVLKPYDEVGVPYFDPKTGITHPNSIRRRRQCQHPDCGRVFFSREGYGGNGTQH